MFICIFTVIAFQGYCGASWYAKSAELKSNVHTIQIALERFAGEHDGIYPPNTKLLLQEGYLVEFPDNPLIKGIQPMHEISFGDKPFQGCFTYIPVKIDGKIQAYYLFAYGFEKRPYRDPKDLFLDVDKDGKHDWVIIVVESDNEQVRSLMPSLEELLN